MVRDGGYGNLAGWLIPRALHCLVECGVFGWRIRSAGADTPPFLTCKTLPTPNSGELCTKLSPRPALLNPNFGELTECPNPVPSIYIYSPEG